MLMPVVCLLSALAASQPKITPIAHAGGGIQSSTYTNSFEALNLNYSKGFKLFELDLVWTTDNQLVCLHDWKTTPIWLLDYERKKPVSLKQFHALDQLRTDVTLCDLSSLNQWLQAHPKALIVTDIKNQNIKGLRLALKAIENAENRLIPQFTQPEEYQTIKNMGFKSIIWTLYKYRGSGDSVVEFAKNMQLFAISMPPYKAKSGLAQNINTLGIPTYVHTVNDLKEALELQNNYGVSAVYTDFLPPDYNAPKNKPGKD